MRFHRILRSDSGARQPFLQSQRLAPGLQSLIWHRWRVLPHDVAFFGVVCKRGVGGTFDAIALVVEEAQVIVHEADQPDVIGDFAHSDGLTGKDLVEIDLASAKAQATALRDDDGAIVEGILQRGKIRAGALGRPVELCRVVHVQSLMRPLAESFAVVPGRGPT